MRSGNDLLPDGTKPLPYPVMSCHHVKSELYITNTVMHVQVLCSQKYNFNSEIFKMIITFPRGQWVKADWWLNYSPFVRTENICNNGLGQEWFQYSLNFDIHMGFSYGWLLCTWWFLIGVIKLINFVINWNRVARFYVLMGEIRI